MFGFEETEKVPTKCYATTAPLPSYINWQQPPTKKKPFSTMRAHPFNHTVPPL